MGVKLFMRGRGTPKWDGKLLTRGGGDPKMGVKPFVSSGVPQN